MSFQLLVDKEYLDELLKKFKDSYWLSSGERQIQEALDIMKKEDKNGTSLITINIREAFWSGVRSREKLERRLMALIAGFANAQKIISVNYNDKVITRTLRKINELDKAGRVVIVNEKLGLIVEHPDFSDIHLEAWERKPEGIFLTKPLFWRRDQEAITQNNFQLKITPEQKRN